MGNPRKLTRRSFVAAVFIVVIVLAVFLRGPYVSNSLKQLILPELEMATGKRVIAQKIYVNIFPLFVEAKGLKVIDDDGARVLFAKRVKAYLDIWGLIGKRLTIRRLMVRDPEVITNEDQTIEIVKHVEDYLSKKRDTMFRITVAVVEVQRGTVSIASSSLKGSAEISGIGGEIITGDAPRIKISAERIKPVRESWPRVAASASASIVVRGGKVTVQNLTLVSDGSRITGTGVYEKDRVDMKTQGEILVQTVKRIFGLQRSGDGRIRAEGDVTYADKKITVDLDVAGSLYLQTLMELLSVKEKVEGLIDFTGKIKGPLQDLTAQGAANLRKGNLFTVDVDSLDCRVSYARGVMTFSDGEGRLYRGRAKVSASIALPVVDWFSLDVDFQDADSKPLFGLIEWDPGVPDGKVAGTLHSSGPAFSPKGRFHYVSGDEGKDVIGRVEDIKGEFDLVGDILELSDIVLTTGTTDILVAGTVDIEKEMLDITGSMRTSDVTDVTRPYYGGLKGKGEFTGTLRGRFQDPVITGSLSLSDTRINEYPAGVLKADVVYRKETLQIRELEIHEMNTTHHLSGSIAFKQAHELFEFSHPVYNLRASLKDAEIERFVRIFYSDFAGKGTFSSSLRITGEGTNPEVRGPVTLERPILFTVPLDSASFELKYASSRVDFSNITAKIGGSILRGDFTINPDDTFSYRARSDRLRLSDIVQRPLQGEVILSLTAGGGGTFDNPAITVDVRIIQGVLKGKNAGAGVIEASLKNREFSVRARLINEKVTIAAKGRTDGDMPWDLSADVQTGRYDFLITSFLKDIPEDLLLNLNGNVSLRGTKEHISGTANIKHVVLSMYGYSFSNEYEITLSLKDRELNLNRISMRSGNTILRAGGSLTVGRRYDLSLEGSSALSPFKSLSAELGLLKGDAEFVVSVSGGWENPRINGGISLVDGALGLKDYTARVSSINGYIYMDNDRVVLQNLSGKLGGGDIAVSGVLYLKKFSFSRFYLEAKLNNITASISSNFSVNFDGDILYKGTPASQAVSGNIDIRRARYRERVEWKSWLLQTRKPEKFKTEISPFEKAELNVRITGEENIFIDNNVARVTVSSDMVLRGTVYRPILFGRLETEEGTVFFRNNEFRIIRASADFSDPKRINPVIEISAETSVKGYRIRMNLEGQLEHFNMSLSSDPILAEMDILSLLTVGQTGGGLKGIEGGVGAGEATSFVTGKMQDVVEERLRYITGLDRFQLDPAVSRKTGTVEPRVTVAKRLIGEKMFVTLTTSVSGTEGQIVKIEYFLGKNVSLIGMRDERGIVGGDIKFRFEFK
jgi:translocation and assembly module TamB